MRIGFRTTKRYLDCCAGISAASVAWHPLGWRAQAFSEIDKFPSAVLAHRWPGVPNLGDMNRWEEWPDLEVDVLVAGTPCVSFSSAGKRLGLSDPRGQLMLRLLDVARRYRPRWVVWENVPNVRASGGGRDFGSLLWGLGQLGYGWAYRVLDAYGFGVPQRRRRVFVVGCLGDQRGAAQVLFAGEGLRRNPRESRTKGEAVAGALTASVGGSDENDAIAGRLIAYSMTGQAHWVEGVSPLRARQQDSHENLVVTHVSVHTQQDPIVGFEVLPCLSAGGRGGNSTAAVSDGAHIRRLTPVEYERLQGFPDNWTRIPWRGKLAEACPDGPRYRALGNSKAVPVVRWIGSRIDDYDTFGSCRL